MIVNPRPLHYGLGRFREILQSLDAEVSYRIICRFRQKVASFANCPLALFCEHDQKITQLVLPARHRFPQG
jgi:hypothetical protein